jgi:hypothetical protein
MLWAAVFMENLLATIAEGLPTSLGHFDMFTVAANRFCADLDAHGFPGTVMAMTRANEGMSDFVKNGILDIFLSITMDVILTEGDNLGAMTTKTSTTFGPIKLERPMT